MDPPELTSRGDCVEAGPYRYLLTRGCDRDGPFDVTWVLFNPSTADATRDDPTLRRVLGFSHREGWHRVAVVNVFALRSTDPRRIRAHRSPVGPDNDRWLARAARRAARVVVAWGNACPPERAADVADRIGAAFCLGLTKCQAPRHPLYVRADTGLIGWQR